MEEQKTLNTFSEKAKKVFSVILKALKNPTFLYILRRILSALFTAILIVAVVTALIRLLPETSLYDIKLYNKLPKAAADRYKTACLFQYGRCDLYGNPISIFENIVQYIYWMLPIYKEIPIKWDAKYDKVLDEFKGTIYFGRSIVQNKFVTDMLVERMGISMKITRLRLWSIRFAPFSAISFAVR